MRTSSADSSAHSDEDCGEIKDEDATCLLDDDPLVLQRTSQGIHDKYTLWGVAFDC